MKKNTFALLAVGCLLAAQGHAQTSKSDYCVAESASVTKAMKIAHDSNQVLETATARYKPGGGRQRLAEVAYRRLEAGDDEARAARTATSFCMRLDVEAMKAEQDDPAQGHARICSDVAAALVKYFQDPAAVSRSPDEGARMVAPAEHASRPLPRIQEAIRYTQMFARQSNTPKFVTDAAMNHCRTVIEAKGRAELAAEFYVK
jgi:hypothetical protein